MTTSLTRAKVCIWLCLCATLLSPLMAVAQGNTVIDEQSARENCNLEALASLVTDEGRDAHELLATLDPECRQAFLNAYITVETVISEPELQVVSAEASSTAAGQRCFERTIGHRVELLGDLQYTVNAYGRMCVNDIVGPGPGIIAGSWQSSTWVQPAGNNWSCSLSHTVWNGLRGADRYTQYGQRWDQYSCENQISSANRISHGAICLRQSGSASYCPYF